jgi:hypothetical protein
MVAGVLVDGDVSLGAGGTVTEVRGDQVWAFGHPFLGGGSVEIPMARARVVTVLPSLQRSFKFFQTGQSIGRFESDRTYGVWGRLGPTVPMVPVSVTVNDRTYSFRTIRNQILLPSLTGYLTNSSLDARGRRMGDQTVELDIELQYEGDVKAGLSETFIGDGASLQAAGMVAAVVGYLENTTFTAPELERISIDLRSVESLESTVMVSATPDRWVVTPGETLPVRIRLRPHRGADITRTVEITIPKSVPEGRLDLVVADGTSWTSYDFQMRPPLTGSFANEIKLFDRLLPSNHIVLALERRQVGVAIPGGPVMVPPSLVVQMRSALGNNLETIEYGVIERVTEEMPSRVLGAERLNLTVRVEDR